MTINPDGFPLRQANEVEKILECSLYVQILLQIVTAHFFCNSSRIVSDFLVTGWIRSVEY